MVAVDTGYYESQRRGIDSTYAAQMATNTFSRTLAQSRGNRGLSFLSQSFGRQTPHFTSSFAQRGLGGAGVQSGVMQHAMQNFLGDYQTQYGQAQNDLTDQLRQYDLTAAQLGANRTSAYADMELAKARDVAFAAQNIEQLRQSLGGL
jgi:hypothetical protein